MRKKRPPSNRRLPAAWSSLPSAPAIPASTELRIPSTERKPQSPKQIANRENARILLGSRDLPLLSGQLDTHEVGFALGRSDKSSRDALGFERDFAVGLGDLWVSQASDNQFPYSVEEWMSPRSFGQS
jgi:hypothetical protein